MLLRITIAELPGSGISNRTLLLLDYFAELSPWDELELAALCFFSSSLDGFLVR
jgi:hypothetical protein